jgi:hypothetical protein
MGCVKGGEAISSDVEDALYSADREVRHCGMGWLGIFEAGVTWEHSFLCSRS